MAPTLISLPYPTADEWRQLVESFSSEAIAHKLLLSQIPFVFRDEPLKYALFRINVAKIFEVEPSNVFIVGSGMSGRSLTADTLDNCYSASSDIDALVVSEPLFTSFLMKSLEWVNRIAPPKYNDGAYMTLIDKRHHQSIGRLANNACRGIWRPDSLPDDAPAKNEFFAKLREVSLATLGLQLSNDTVAKVSGRVARSIEYAIQDLAKDVNRLKQDLRKRSGQGRDSAAVPDLPDSMEIEAEKL